MVLLDYFIFAVPAAVLAFHDVASVPKLRHAMIAVLVYLFEQYYHAPAYPDQDTLAKKLSRAGFESEDISEALDWMRGLADREDAPFPNTFDEGKSFRCSTCAREWGTHHEPFNPRSTSFLFAPSCVASSMRRC